MVLTRAADIGPARHRTRSRPDPMLQNPPAEPGMPIEAVDNAGPHRRSRCLRVQPRHDGQHGGLGRREASAPCQDPQVARRGAPADGARRRGAVRAEGRRGRGPGLGRRGRHLGQQRGREPAQARTPRGAHANQHGRGLRRRPARHRGDRDGGPGRRRAPHGPGRDRRRGRPLRGRAGAGGRDARPADRRELTPEVRRAAGLSWGRPAPAHTPGAIGQQSRLPPR